TRDRFEFNPFFPVDDDVADLAGVTVETMIQLAIEDQAAADTRAGEDAKYMLGSLSSALCPFAIGAHANVIVDDDRPGPVRRKERLQIKIAPVEIGSITDDC